LKKEPAASASGHRRAATPNPKLNETLSPLLVGEATLPSGLFQTTYQAARFRQKIRGPVPKMRKLDQFVSLFRHGLSL
jgi:hypothetical protein